MAILCLLEAWAHCFNFQNKWGNHFFWDPPCFLGPVTHLRLKLLLVSWGRTLITDLQLISNNKIYMQFGLWKIEQRESKLQILNQHNKLSFDYLNPCFWLISFTSICLPVSVISMHFSEWMMLVFTW